MFLLPLPFLTRPAWVKEQEPSLDMRCAFGKKRAKHDCRTLLAMICAGGRADIYPMAVRLPSSSAVEVRSGGLAGMA